MFDLKWVLSRDDRFRYGLLSRMKMDCLRYLGYGNRNPKNLWANNEKEQIEYMKAIWNSFSDDGKPEWLTFGQIVEYEKAMMVGHKKTEEKDG